MRRTNLAYFVAGMTVAAFTFGLGVWWSSPEEAKGEVTIRTVLKPYTPEFGEWVGLWLDVNVVVMYQSSYMVGAAPEVTARGRRWVIEYVYKAGNTSALEMVKRAMASNKKTVMVQVNDWKKRGYQIEFSDFVFKLCPT